MKKSTLSLSVCVVCIAVILLLAISDCSYMMWKAKHFLNTMNSTQIGSMTREQFLEKLKPYRSAQGSCISGREKEACYAYGFNSPVLVRLHILPDVVLIGNAFFEGDVLVQKSEHFKSQHFAISVNEGRPDPYTEFRGRVYLAKTNGSQTGFHIQVNPEAAPPTKEPAYAFQMKCFIWSGICRDAHDALPTVKADDSDF
jgi:hypothetical protein